MKNLRFLMSCIALMAFVGDLFSQNVPQATNYQAVLRNAAGNPRTNETVTFYFTVEEGFNPGTPVYREKQTVVTNQLGLVATKIGLGTPVLGIFADIRWETGNKYLMVEMDDSSSSEGLINMGITQLVSVPYALYALRAGSISSSNTGPSGAIGSTGATGNTGPIGATGPQGLVGATGAQGPRGFTGTQGLPGTTGPTGSNGSTGPQGLAGTNGLTGPTGSSGTNGSNGTTGATGTQGLPGVTGLLGATGPQGIQGATGNAGPTGPQGLQGAQGVTGSQGLQGVTGIAGATGPQGLVGATGAQGLPGSNGLNGAVGPTGLQGIAGPTGGVVSLIDTTISYQNSLTPSTVSFTTPFSITLPAGTYNMTAYGGLSYGKDTCGILLVRFYDGGNYIYRTFCAGPAMLVGTGMYYYPFQIEDAKVPFAAPFTATIGFEATTASVTINVVNVCIHIQQVR